MHFNMFTAGRWLKEDCFCEADRLTPAVYNKYTVTFDPQNFWGRVHKQGMEQVSEVIEWVTTS